MVSCCGPVGLGLPAGSPRGRLSAGNAGKQLCGHVVAGGLWLYGACCIHGCRTVATPAQAGGVFVGLWPAVHCMPGSVDGWMPSGLAPPHRRPCPPPPGPCRARGQRTTSPARGTRTSRCLRTRRQRTRRRPQQRPRQRQSPSSGGGLSSQVRLGWAGLGWLVGLGWVGARVPTPPPPPAPPAPVCERCSINARQGPARPGALHTYPLLMLCHASSGMAGCAPRRP